MHAAAGEVIDQYRAAANLSTDRLEQALIQDLMPRPAADASTRQLKRDEARIVAARVGGVPGLIQLIGNDPQLDAELIGDYGRALFKPEDYAALRTGAIAKLLHSDGGLTERQAAAQRTLATFHKVKIRGLVASAYHVARARLG